MKQLTIEHLAPYLPYGLKTNHGILWALCNDNLVKCKTDDSEIIKGSIGSVYPYLRPLSQLTKEIEHNGERFVTVDRLNQLSYPETIAFRYRSGHLLFNGDGSEWNFLGLPMEALQLLFSLHFDVFGLIDAGLALPIEN